MSLLSLPAPMVRVLVFAIISGIHFAESPTMTTVEIAIQRCPVEPKQAPIMALIVSSLSASGITIA